MHFVTTLIEFLWYKQSNTILQYSNVAKIHNQVLVIIQVLWHKECDDILLDFSPISISLLLCLHSFSLSLLFLHHPIQNAVSTFLSPFHFSNLLSLFWWCYFTCLCGCYCVAVCRCMLSLQYLSQTVHPHCCHCLPLPPGWHYWLME